MTEVPVLQVPDVVVTMPAHREGAGVQMLLIAVPTVTVNGVQLVTLDDVVIKGHSDGHIDPDMVLAVTVTLPITRFEAPTLPDMKEKPA